MAWWLKMRRVWVALSLRVKAGGSPKSDGAVGGNGGRCDTGLLKLQDEVQVCGYKDVEVMWSMLYTSSQEQRAVQVRKTRKQKHAWRALFLTKSKQDIAAATPSSVSSCFMFGFKSY